MLRVLALACVLVACDEGDSEREDMVLALSGDTTSGEALYRSFCVSCHADDGSGGIGSDIRSADLELLVDAMVNGRPSAGMQDYADLLEDQEMADIAAYAETL